MAHKDKHSGSPLVVAGNRCHELLAGIAALDRRNSTRIAAAATAATASTASTSSAASPSRSCGSSGPKASGGQGCYKGRHGGWRLRVAGWIAKTHDGACIQRLEYYSTMLVVRMMDDGSMWKEVTEEAV